MGLSLHVVSGLGREFYFLLNSEIDHIQRVLRRGGFYEREELELIAEHARSPRWILDVGSNIGNHAIYFAHRFNPDHLAVVEPNPEIINLLRANLGMNWHKSMDLTYVGSGLSDRAGQGESYVTVRSNIGGAKLKHTDDGKIPIYRGDDIFPTEAFDLIKIDVEGMEFQVLLGMEALLNRSSGLVFLEVLLPNIDRAISMMRDVGYEYEVSYQRYGRCTNLLFLKP
jgi:FkbM family methyltransferase